VTYAYIYTPKLELISAINRNIMAVLAHPV